MGAPPPLPLTPPLPTTTSLEAGHHIITNTRSTNGPAQAGANLTPTHLSSSVPLSYHLPTPLHPHPPIKIANPSPIPTSSFPLPLPLFSSLKPNPCKTSLCSHCLATPTKPMVISKMTSTSLAYTKFLPSSLSSISSLT